MESTWHTCGTRRGQLVMSLPTSLYCRGGLSQTGRAPLKGSAWAPLPSCLVPICSQIPSPPFPVLLCLAGNSTSQASWQQALGYSTCGRTDGRLESGRRRQGDCPLLPSSVFGFSDSSSCCGPAPPRLLASDNYVPPDASIPVGGTGSFLLLPSFWMLLISY